MTVVKASFVNGVRVPIGGGTITYTPDRPRATVADSAKTVAPVDVTAEIVAGVAQDRDLEPGPYSVRIEVEWFLETYPIIVPAAGPVQLMELIDDSTPYEPPVVSLVKQYRDQAQQASAIAVAAAEGVAGIGEDLERIAQDRAAAELARDKSIEAQGISESAAASAGDSATNAGNSARDAKDFRDGAEEFATAADGSATAAGQSEEAAAQHKAAAEAASERSEQIAAGIQDVAEDAAQVAEDRLAVESAASAVATDRQTVTTAHDVVIAAKTDVEQIQTDVHQTKGSIENTASLVDQTLAQYGTQFVAERELSQQAVTDATTQAQRAEDAADGIVAGSVLDNAVTTPKLADEAVTKAKTSPGVQASLGKADTSVQEGDPRLTDARTPTTHTHTEAQVTGLTVKLATKADLDGGGKILAAQIPAVALTDFLGAVGTQAAMLALTGQRGDWCTRTDRGTDWQLIAEPSSTLANWREKTYPASPVSSVNGRTGAVDTSSADITDATTVGRNVIKAADAAAARAAIGAGTGNGTSNLAIGTTSTSAMRGDANQIVTALPTTGQLTGVIYHVTE
ncbi:MAG: hypothetical protein U5O16_14565 [Rhodococcus sp. (in: high G+C Gram-positive bacteria)]|uniref:hypothetical protein n=1 Tax=Rhodococcus sp. TaxID=1831 RepID=UPI002ADBA374|nr:hypothetical protein [Rhodococcus sp. (in: high G+C Gram-positive bacteria)]MDZ7913035.1 hypothetical protein [Rhodococcus sp. (in: high G+C Gram-positive bacteria)]